jgi:hypothetical protein
MKTVISLIWLLSLTAGLIYAAVTGNPVAQGFLFFLGVIALAASVIAAAVNIGNWWDRA